MKPHPDLIERARVVDAVGMRREMLIAALRDEKTWPCDFEWNFTNCKTCAIGLFEQLFQQPNNHREMLTLLGLPIEDFDDTFCLAFAAKTYGTDDYKSITPTMVADRLEQVHRQIQSALTEAAFCGDGE